MRTLATFLSKPLAAGCPLLISDETIWTEIEEREVGWRIPLSAPERYIEQIKDCIDMDNDRYSRMSEAARKYALEWLARPEFETDNAAVLQRAVGERTKTIANG